MASIRRGIKRALDSWLVLPIGFGVGWGSFVAMEYSGVLEKYPWLARQLEDAQKYCHYQWEYALFLSSYRLDPPRPPVSEEDVEKMAFSSLLQQCSLEDQMYFLLEHTQEEIPYFYIDELFASFASLHEENLPNAAKLQNDDLCKGIAQKMVHGQVSAHTSARVMNILATNPQNCRVFAKADIFNALLHRAAESETAEELASLLTTMVLVSEGNAKKSWYESLPNKGQLVHDAMLGSSTAVAQVHSIFEKLEKHHKALEAIAEKASPVNLPAEDCAFELLRKAGEAVLLGEYKGHRMVMERWMQMMAFPSIGPRTCSRIAEGCPSAIALGRYIAPLPDVVLMHSIYDACLDCMENHPDAPGLKKLFEYVEIAKRSQTILKIKDAADTLNPNHLGNDR